MQLFRLRSVVAESRTFSPPNDSHAALISWPQCVNTHNSGNLNRGCCAFAPIELAERVANGEGDAKQLEVLQEAVHEVDYPSHHMPQQFQS